jgi:hypothetical protein
LCAYVVRTGTVDLQAGDGSRSDDNSATAGTIYLARSSAGPLVGFVRVSEG